MAKKINNLLIGTMIGSFMVLFLGTFLFEADSVTISSSEKVGSELLEIGIAGTNDYRDTEVSLQDNTFETGVFALPENQLVETRGISQGNIISKNSPSNAKQSFSSFSEKVKIPFIVNSLAISLIVITGITLLVRLFRGEGAA